MKIKYFLVFFSFALFSIIYLAYGQQADYIYLTKDDNKLAEIVTLISSWDEDKSSPLCQLSVYISEGHSVAVKDVVLQALAHAELVVEKSTNKILPEQQVYINDALDMLADEIHHGNLSVDKVDRDLCDCSIIRIREKLYVFNKAKFFDKVEIKNNLDIRGKLHVHCNALFNNNVTIDGSLSVGDLVILSCLDSVCVNNLSVVDESISGIVSVNDAAIRSATIACDLTVGCNLSINDSMSGAVGNIIKNDLPFIHTYPPASLNTFVGQNVGNFTMTGMQNVAIGANSFINNSSGTGNTTIGTSTMLNNTTGTRNTVVGDAALLSNTIGSFNTAIGFLSMFTATTGNTNVAVGDTSLANNITGSNNVGVGVSTFASGDDNVIIGFNAGNDGSRNIGIGSSALFNAESDQNVAVGYGAMAGSSSTNGNNVALGYEAFFNVQGSFNIAIGSSAGNGSTLSTSDNNIYIANNGVDESGAIRVGTAGTHTSCFVQGINGVTTGLAAVPVLVDGNGQLGTVSSSIQFKHDINKMGSDSEVIYQLNPVTFVFNNDSSETKQYGLIAEEVECVFPAIVVKDSNGQPVTIQYQILPLLLLNELIKQHQIIVWQNKVIENINNRLSALE